MKIKFAKLTKSLLIIVFIFSISKTFSQQKDKPVNNSIDTTVLSKVEVEASFPGGDIAWNKYVINAFKDAPVNFKNSDQGTCRIRFIVDKKGNISNVEALNMKRTRLAKFAIEVISNGPRWHPAQQDNKFVNAYREQPITLTLSDK
jgi:protein TonB